MRLLFCLWDALESVSVGSDPARPPCEAVGRNSEAYCAAGQSDRAQCVFGEGLRLR
jgi:hypothetical protein